MNARKRLWADWHWMHSWLQRHRTICDGCASKTAFCDIGLHVFLNWHYLGKALVRRSTP